jgi:hypothetical protein
MGHKTIHVTMRYSHLAPRHQFDAVQRLCDTGLALSETTDTSAFEASGEGSARPN